MDKSFCCGDENRRCVCYEQYRDEEPVCNYFEKNSYLISRLKRCPNEVNNIIKYIENKGW